jgi:hypothetical protein
MLPLSIFAQNVVRGKITYSSHEKKFTDIKGVRHYVNDKFETLYSERIDSFPKIETTLLYTPKIDTTLKFIWDGFKYVKMPKDLRWYGVIENFNQLKDSSLVGFLDLSQSIINERDSLRKENKLLRKWNGGIRYDLQKIIDESSEGEIIYFSDRDTFVIEKPIQIKFPIKIYGLILKESIKIDGPQIQVLCDSSFVEIRNVRFISNKN